MILFKDATIPVDVADGGGVGCGVGGGHWWPTAVSSGR